MGDRKPAAYLARACRGEGDGDDGRERIGEDEQGPPTPGSTLAKGASRR